MDGWMSGINQDRRRASPSTRDGDGLVISGNRNGDAASIMGANENGHGIIGFRNASGRVVAAMGADSTGIGVLNIEGGRFRAFVDANRNGVAETRGERWESSLVIRSIPRRGHRHVNRADRGFRRGRRRGFQRLPHIRQEFRQDKRVATSRRIATPRGTGRAGMKWGWITVPKRQVK